jgi:hypothetical protein
MYVLAFEHEKKFFLARHEIWVVHPCSTLFYKYLYDQQKKNLLAQELFVIGWWNWLEEGEYCSNY